MKESYSDTSRRVESFHIMLLRKASVYKRLAMTRSLTKTALRLSWQGICERYASESIEAQLERFISFLYNDGILARRVIDALVKKGKPTK